ncbi:hypothetical protein CHH78_17800 [Shouchella clausii]|uniref:Competence protein ComG n=1 Tax=Shouchella clausii TaxID=79880 RepID=A0A268RZ12_SHOCL|nr:hypothetical protein CHH76_01330 [Shouchella clausii]PAD43006.1 hypothetical protein CHH54_09070 [Bacillus sp. 7520-S]PAD12358.1 hypothetical protein CHH74_15865 [Shouchella clausii]PAD90773.1 hypothetical protein CHH52_18510 [Shouchella clausii]PAE79155.1 hypothetical protein CHH78_17800 [Shouchella clausii]
MWLSIFIKNERGAILPLTLLTFLVLGGYFSYQLFHYERERLFYEQQLHLLQLENALQLAVLDILASEGEEIGDKHYPMGTVSIVQQAKEDKSVYEFEATLKNGATRKARVTVNADWKMVAYEEGL